MSVLYSNFIVNEKNKVIFAYIPKVACSNWKGIMRSLNGEDNYLDTSYAHDRKKSGLTYLSNIQEKEKYLKGDEYKRLTFVRNPYSRVLSAYLNKVESRINKPINPNDHFSIVYDDINSFREKKLDKKLYPTVSFEVFLIWLRDSKSIYTYDEHWKPQSLLLDIKNIIFHKIGRFEELSDSANEFTKILGSKVDFPTQKEIKFSPTKAASKIETYYTELAYKLVNDIYKEDFKNFNYTINFKKKHPSVTKFDYFEKERKIINYNEGVYILDSPIELDSFDSLVGAGKNITTLKFVGNFKGPVIKTARLQENIKNKTWFYEDGIPVRFSIKNLTIDLTDWTPDESTDSSLDFSNENTVGLGLYGKSYTIKDVIIVNTPHDAFLSLCSSQGGKKSFHLDSPESVIDGLEIINSKNKGFVFAGPHDSIIKQVITCHTKGKGVEIISNKDFSGACDIDFIHAYASDDIAIDINAKVKARFLQGDTGRYAGVRVSASNKTIIETIEAFKTRGSQNDHSVIIDCAESQINTIRIRADAGAQGLKLGGFGNIINSLHIETHKQHPDFDNIPFSETCLPILVAGNQNTILLGRVFTKNYPIIDTNKKIIKRFECKIVSNGPRLEDTHDSELFEISDINIKHYGI